MDVRELLDGADDGDNVRAPATSFAEDAGITLRDEPMPLWQLLVLTQLLSARISSDVAVRTATVLWTAGWRTPEALRAAPRARLVAALGRGGYRRYDESTATRLAQNAALVKQRWHDDLRQLRDEADTGRGSEKDARAIARLLQEFDGIGPTGAGIFLREVQGVWPLVHPYADPLVLKGAERLGLPTDVDALFADIPAPDAPRLAAALVRAAKRPTRR